MTNIADLQKQIRTICPYCGVGCGVEVSNYRDGRARVKGDHIHPANFGKLCGLGGNLAKTLTLENRLLHPMINGSRVEMATALEATTEGLLAIVREHGPDAVAAFGSGQLLTEDYYVINKLMKGFIGCANFDTNSRLCMASSVAGQKRAFGTDTVSSCYEDIENADLIVLVGSNAASCHPVLYGRILAAKKKNPVLKLILVDPRETPSCKNADLHLALKAGTDLVLLEGLLSYLDTNECTNVPFVKNHTEDHEKVLSRIRSQALDHYKVATICDLPENDVLSFFELFSSNHQTVSLFAEGINQSSSGTDSVNAIINAHLLTGRIGKPGANILSLTGQPNAMGGREVGGLADQLAAHMHLDSPADRNTVGEFWASGNVASKPGLTAINMFNAMLSGQIKAVWIMGTNPAVSMPNAGAVRKALEKCDLVIVSDVVEDTDTTSLANILLPALPWGEKDGTVTNSERCISRMRPVRTPSGEAKPDWWLVQEVAKRMGYQAAFSFASPAEIFRDHAALSGFKNNGKRSFDISALASVTDEEYEKLAPIQWPVNKANPQGTKRLFEQGIFFSDTKKAKFVPSQQMKVRSTDFPFVLNTGRLRSQWHTMTRTSLAPKLNAMALEPLLFVNPDDGLQLEVVDHDVVEVSSEWGATLLRVKLSKKQRRREAFAPMHWSEKHAKHARVGLVASASIDPISEQPELKHTRVRLKKIEMPWHGFVLSRRKLELPDFSYWVKGKGPKFQFCDFAELGLEYDWERKARAIFRGKGVRDGVIESISHARDDFRFARIVDSDIEECLVVSRRPKLLFREWLKSTFNAPRLHPSFRKEFLEFS